MSLELFRTTNIDWLGKKWFFLGFSLIFSVAGVLSILFWHHIPLGVDFKGGTQIRVAFNQTPNEDQIRQAMDRAGVHNALIQRVSDPSGHAANKVIIALPESADQSHDVGRQAVENALAANYLIMPRPRSSRWRLWGRRLGSSCRNRRGWRPSTP